MFFFGHFFFSFFVSSQFLRRFSRLKIVHHVSRVRRVRAAVPHRQGTYSSRFPKTTTTTTTIVVVFAPFFLSSPSFFFQRQSALKVVSLSIAKQKRTLWTCRSSLSLSLYTLGTKLQAETSRHRGAKGKHHRREERGENAEK